MTRRKEPGLTGLTEIAEMLGVSRQRAKQIMDSPGAPEPLERLRMGPVWSRPEVVRYLAPRLARRT